ncbi:hypothetical protein A8B77_00020 [Erythrobacter sp. EhN03]|jgi:hypothetical protein|uniref:hypothetical protein n=1 Tax=Qipengyuania flava TaxID=192812 RepID=UPI0007F4C84E|nr:hypothetical protein A8B77_00020 [Erythrobacter sp. EhN03]
MNSKFALSIAAAVMLLVLAMLGEGGAVSNIAQADAAQTEQARRILSRGGDPQPVSAPGASSPWAVSADTPATPHGASITAASAIPVYEYRNVPVAIPQEIIDPDKAAASPIR